MRGVEQRERGPAGGRAPEPRLVRLVVAALAVVGLAAVVGASVAGRWDPPPLTALDLGAAGAPQVDGTWVARSVEVEGRTTDLGDQSVVLDLDTTIARLEGRTGCNPLLGSFTLTADGDASFTVPNRRPAACDPVVDAAEDDVVAALEGATTWAVAGGELVLSGPATRLELAAG